MLEPIVYYQPRSRSIRNSILWILAAGVFWASWEMTPVGLFLFALFLGCFTGSCFSVLRLFSPVPSVRIDSFGVWTEHGPYDLSLVLWNEIISMGTDESVLRCGLKGDGKIKISAGDVPVPLEELLDQIKKWKARQEQRSPEPVVYYPLISSLTSARVLISVFIGVCAALCCLPFLAPDIRLANPWRIPFPAAASVLLLVGACAAGVAYKMDFWMRRARALSHLPVLRLDASGVLIRGDESKEDSVQVSWGQVRPAELKSIFSRGSPSRWVVLHLKDGATHEFRYGDLSIDGVAAVDPRSVFKQIKFFQEEAA